MSLNWSSFHLVTSSKFYLTVTIVDSDTGCLNLPLNWGNFHLVISDFIRVHDCDHADTSDTDSDTDSIMVVMGKLQLVTSSGYMTVMMLTQTGNNLLLNRVSFPSTGCMVRT